MNLSTLIIGIVVLALVGLAIRYLVKNGACAACEGKEACMAAKKASGSNASAGCGGKCSSCKYYEMEQKALTAKH